MQQFCTYGSVRGASGQPASLPRQKSGSRVTIWNMAIAWVGMRGQDRQQSAMFSYVSPEERVPAKHPLRPIRAMADEALKSLSPMFDRMYATFGRPSIAPEKLLRALLVQMLYTVRSERILMEQLQYNLLFRWFVGMNMDEPVWVPTVFSKNRDRLTGRRRRREVLRADTGSGARGGSAFRRALQRGRHFDRSLGEPEELSAEGSSRKPPPDDPGNPTVDFHGERRSNETHESKTDPDARLARKSGGHESKLAYCGNVLIENRNGLVVDTELVQCNGTRGTGCGAADGRVHSGRWRVTVAGDKGYDTKEFVARCAA